MLFNSIEFLIFLPLVFFGYWFVFKSLRWQNLFVVAVSYLFYGWWDWRFLLLILFTSLCSYLSGVYLEKCAGNRSVQKWISAGNILLNLSILGVFKYFDFFTENLVNVLHLLGWDADYVTLNILLPVGISFYTFQALSYTIDVYQGKIKATHDIVAFFAYISFFPQLVAGPIERATHLLPQFLRPRNFDCDLALDGIRQMLWGFFKKVVVADNCALFVNGVFENYQTLDGSTLFLGAFFFTIQIYGDFSGYSDIAIGCARLFGIDLMQNFKYPYFSRDIAEFWRRWHISLGSWFRDYLYIPLGGNRKGSARQLLNILLVWLATGLWHGADWRYLAWGLFTGLLAAFGVMTARARQRINRYNPLYRMGWFKVFWQCLFTNALFCLTLVFFASAIYNTDPFAVYGSLLQGWDGLTGSWAQVSNLIYSSGIDGRLPVVLLFGCFVVFAAEHKGRSVARWIRQQVWPLRWTLYYGMAAAILFFAAFGQSAFIYQQY